MKFEMIFFSSVIGLGGLERRQQPVEPLSAALSDYTLWEGTGIGLGWAGAGEAEHLGLSWKRVRVAFNKM